MSHTIKLGLDLIQTQTLIEKLMLDKIKAKKLDTYQIEVGEKLVVVTTYEKYFTRAANEASLTVTIDSINKFTRVHFVAAAGGSWLGKLDFAAEEDFESFIQKELETYKIND